MTDIGVKLRFSLKILVCVHRSQYLLRARSELLKVTGTRSARISFKIEDVKADSLRGPR